MNVKFYSVASLKTFNTTSHKGIFVHLTSDSGDFKAGLYFGGNDGWEYLTNVSQDTSSEIHSGSVNTDTGVVSFFNSTDGTGDALFTVSIADYIAAEIAKLATDGDVQAVTKSVDDTTGDVTITFNGVSESNGVIAQGEGTDTVVLKKVATTGKATDITLDQYKTNDELEEGESPKIAQGANLQTVIEGLIDAIEDTNSSAALTLNNDSGVLTGDNAVVKADGTTYTLKQGSDVVAKFNIVKDSFVKSGEVVYGTLTDGTFTAAEAAKDGSNAYIHLVVNTNDGSGNKTEKSDDIYIPASSLIQYSSVANGDLYLSSSDDHVISVTDKIKNAITKVEGLTVNGQEVADDGTVTITADDIEYKAATTGENATDAVSVKDAIDDIDDRISALEDDSHKQISVTGDGDTALENTGINVNVVKTDATDAAGANYAVSAELVWLDTLPD